jgi:hypothetical protein
MSVWLEKLRRHLDGRHKTSRHITVRSAFQNFTEILSWFELRSDGVALSPGQLHFSCTQFPYQGFERPNGWSYARNFHISSSRVRTMKADVWMSEFWMRNLPYGWAHPDGNPHCPDGCSDLPLYVLWKEILLPVEHWVSSGRAAETSRRKQAGTVWSFSTQRKVRMENSHRPDGWFFEQLGVRTVYHVVWMATRDPIFLICRLCRIF